MMNQKKLVILKLLAVGMLSSTALESGALAGRFPCPGNHHKESRPTKSVFRAVQARPATHQDESEGMKRAVEASLRDLQERQDLERAIADSMESTAQAQAAQNPGALRTDQETVTHLNALSVRIYRDDNPHKHDQEMRREVPVALKLFDTLHPDIKLLPFQDVVAELKTAALDVDRGILTYREGSSFPKPELGAKRHATWAAVIPARLSHAMFNREMIQPLVVRCFALAQEDQINGLGGLVVACGLKAGANSTDSAVYNDLFRYLIEKMQTALDDREEAAAAILAINQRFGNLDDVGAVGGYDGDPELERALAESREVAEKQSTSEIAVGGGASHEEPSMEDVAHQLYSDVYPLVKSGGLNDEEIKGLVEGMIRARWPSVFGDTPNRGVVASAEEDAASLALAEKLVEENRKLAEEDAASLAFARTLQEQDDQAFRDDLQKRFQ